MTLFAAAADSNHARDASRITSEVVTWQAGKANVVGAEVERDVEIVHVQHRHVNEVGDDGLWPHSPMRPRAAA